VISRFGCYAALLIVLCACAPVAGPASDSFPAPDFALSALDGSPVRLSDYLGRWVVVNFWATWCAPCVAEMPALQALADSAPDSVTVLGVNLREDSDSVRAFAAAHGIRFLLLLNPDDATVLAYSVVGLPQTLLVDPTGRVVERSFGPVNITRLEERMSPSG
jgi:cytochrome c biogenesis protein CcmG/thiol:disulfide interchange protein DsbE